MRIDYNSPEALAPVVEALLFASDEPLSAQLLRSIILGEEVVKTSIENPESTETVAESELPEQATSGEESSEETDGHAPDSSEELIEDGSPKKKARRKRKSPIELPTLHASVELLNGHYEASDRAFRIVEIAGGYQF